MSKRTKMVMKVVFAIFAVLAMAGLLMGQAGTLFVKGNKVGIGSANPLAQLHVESETSNGNVIVMRSTDDQVLMRFFETTNTGGLMSLFDNVGNESFRISAEGDSWFASAGQLGVGCRNSDAAMTIGSNVNCNVAPFSRINPGDVTFTTSSSRTMKENLSPVGVADILGKISDTKVYQYDFKNGPRDRIGLMAEDFHRIFRRGSDKTLSGQEVEMALWLAVQQLTERNDKLSQRVADLEARLGSRN